MDKLIKRALCLVIGVLIFLNSESQAYSLGLGIVLGGPTGISLKAKPGGRNSIDGAIGLSDRLTLQGHYVIHHDRYLYYGIGARLRLASDDNDNGKDDNDMAIYARAPLGLRYFIDRIELFGEAAILMRLTPSTDLSIDLAAGIRYYF